MAGLNSSSTGRSISGARRGFGIDELVLIQGSYTPFGESFSFSSDQFSSPRGPWTYALKLRTKRVDLPGAEEPTEQVLGWNYEPFTCAGVWDDRHGGAGFADDIRQRFELLVKRGNMIQITTENITIMGLITSLEIIRRRRELIGYKFIFSPHNRHTGETVRTDTSPSLAIKNDPRSTVKLARAAFEDLQAAQAQAVDANNSSVQQKLTGSTFDDINDILGDIDNSISAVESTVSAEIMIAVETTNAFQRGAQLMTSVGSSCSGLLALTRDLAASSDITASNILDILGFESWKRGVDWNTRALGAQVAIAQVEFALQAQSKPTTLYRTRDGETLYTVSTKFFGTPQHWREIMLTNNLSSIIVPTGTILSIPGLGS